MALFQHAGTPGFGRMRLAGVLTVLTGCRSRACSIAGPAAAPPTLYKRSARAYFRSSGKALLSITRRSTKLECTPVTPSMRVIRLSSSS